MAITAKDIEIMSPVGSYEMLMAAIQGGADSVYFGIGNLNMRSKSSKNFTTEDLKKIVDICNEHKVRTYITLNTVIYDQELENMREIVDAAKNMVLQQLLLPMFQLFSMHIHRELKFIFQHRAMLLILKL